MLWFIGALWILLWVTLGTLAAWAFGWMFFTMARESPHVLLLLVASAVALAIPLREFERSGRPKLLGGRRSRRR